MAVLTFQPRFVPLVESGKKTMTIRSYRKRPLRLGEKLSLRTWTGRPYASPQRVLKEGHVIDLRSVKIDQGGQLWMSRCTSPNTITMEKHIGLMAEAVAHGDGFENYAAMLLWFRANRGLSFEGVAIFWK